MGLKGTVINLLLVGVFAFALITGGIMLGTNNNADQNIGDSPALSAYRADINDTLSDAHSDANSSLESVGKSPITLVTGLFIFDAIGGVWKTLKVVPVTIYNLTFGVAKEQLFGNSPAFDVVFGVLSAILIIVIIFGVWKWIASGQDD